MNIRRERLLCRLDRAAFWVTVVLGLLLLVLAGLTGQRMLERGVRITFPARHSPK